ncbi:MAG: ATP-binding cassette domain-containing protein [Candidatus Amulumruptor sp.]|nr:ATP-binding cassette domain-containing protein [Candidatus Amulumruptor sp.]MDE7237242.1 ATP-binding cassette domain-containing protein [Paramuribaculum sp.]
MIETITLSDLLPKVFDGMQHEPAIARSEVWLQQSLTFSRGCRISIEAESGGGKSSLLAFIYGNRTDYLGTIRFDGRDTSSLDIDTRCGLRRRSLALLPQEMRLFGELTVMENILLKNRLTDCKSEREITAMLERLGIADKADTRADRLSIGQQQRVAAVRAVCQPFDFLLLDEPVSHLDECRNREVASLFDEEASAQGAGIITTSVGHALLLDNLTVIRL